MSSVRAGGQPRNQLDAANHIVEVECGKQDGALIHAVNMKPAGMDEHQHAEGGTEGTQRSAIDTGDRRHFLASAFALGRAVRVIVKRTARTIFYFDARLRLALRRGAGDRAHSNDVASRRGDGARRHSSWR